MKKDIRSTICKLFEEQSLPITIPVAFVRMRIHKDDMNEFLKSLENDVEVVRENNKT